MILTDVLYRIYIKPLAIQAQYSREQAQAVAALASLGMISTIQTGHTYGRHWRVTSLGISLLKEDSII